MSLPPPSSDSARTADASEPRTLEDLESALDRLLDPVLSLRRTALPLAEEIAPLARAQQDLVLHWVTVTARTNIELAYQLAAHAPHALSALDAAAAEAWIIAAMDTYDREGLHPATEILSNAASFIPVAPDVAGVNFEEVARVLRLVIHGLSGRPMKLDSALRSYTDTETLYLPVRMARAGTSAENFFLYKASAVLLWAQNRYGTFNADLLEACAGYADPQRALELLNALETLRLESRIARVLPGLARELAALRRTPLDPRCAPLLDISSTVHDSLALLGVLYDAPPALDHPYGIVLDPAHTAAVRRARIAREKDELQSALARLLEEQAGEIAAAGGQGRFSLEIADGESEDDSTFTLNLDRKPLAPPADVSRLIDSITQDLGRVPDEYLQAPAEAARHDAGSDSLRIPPHGRAFYYDEWDYQRRHYRKSWCVLRELEIEPGDAGFVEAALARYSANIVQLKRAFERMRFDPRLLKRQPEGDDIDLDALVEAYADMRHGAELSPLVFTKRRKHERDLAVMFMVDMSGSTKGWINEAEREALVMLCEALEVLGDRYAIYGFSGMTRKRCEIFRVKSFAEPYGALVHRRIAGIEPQDYTRMGAAIRHLTMLLNNVQARTKLLITLSDGRPDDYSDEYRGQYGIEDTRLALMEAHRAGVKPFCITIDSEARDYLSHMYGAVNWTLIDDVSRLPLKVAEVYRRLTS